MEYTYSTLDFYEGNRTRSVRVAKKELEVKDEEIKEENLVIKDKEDKEND